LSGRQADAAEYVRSLLSYNPETGELRWRVSRARTAKKGNLAGCRSTANGGGLIVTVDGQGYRATHLIWLIVEGYMPDHEIDHENGDSFDNRWRNLREATHMQNCWNRKRRSTNTSGYTGVSWHKGRWVPGYSRGTQRRCADSWHPGCWQARIQVDGRTIHLGEFDTAEEAAVVYEAAARQHFGEFYRVG
jgi:hypothetical protein